MEEVKGIYGMVLMLWETTDGQMRKSTSKMGGTQGKREFFGKARTQGIGERRE
jgi:hypothetical protein